jgi:hypothetical protein
MAVTSQGNVYKADTTADAIPACTVEHVLWVPGTASAASLTVGSVVVWQGANARLFEDAEIKADGPITVTLTGGTGTIYLYTEVE